jgi:hypothetical protein
MGRSIVDRPRLCCGQLGSRGSGDALATLLRALVQVSKETRKKKRSTYPTGIGRELAHEVAPAWLAMPV